MRVCIYMMETISASVIMNGGTQQQKVEHFLSGKQHIWMTKLPPVLGFIGSMKSVFQESF